MKKIAKYRYFSFILHALAWSIVLCFPYFISNADSQYKIGPLPGLYFTLSGVVHMIIFYTNSFYLYPKLLNRAYWWLYILAAISLIVLSRGLKLYILSRWLLQWYSTHLWPAQALINWQHHCPLPDYQNLSRYELHQ